MMTPGTTIAHYRIVSKLGEGGMGAVYRATDTKLQRDVAIKVLPEAFARDEERLGRLVREAQVLASLNHPNIATIYGLEERAIVMELVEGPTLADRLQQGALPLEEALAVARQIGEALEVAHERGIIHRDLKPANVKLTAEGQVKVLDFGLAKLTDAAEPGEDPASAPTVVRGNSPTLTGVIMGTAGYMAPEQARGLRVDKRADIWAFGVVLFEMLTGRGLYSGGETMADTLAAVILKDPEWGALPAGTPRGVRRLLERCLQRDRKKRLRDIGDAWVLLEEEAGVGEVVAAPVAVGRRTVVPWVVAAVCAVGAFGVGFRHFRETPEALPVFRYEINAPEDWRIHTFALSPDGRYLAVAADIRGKRKLWIRPMDALQYRALEGTDGATYPFWSPDSRSIGFFAEGKLKRIGLDGGPPQVLCAAANGRGGSWNREGVILFAPANNGGLQRVPAAGGVPAAVTQMEEGVAHRFPVFLEDGRRFLFTAGPGPQEKLGIYEGSLDAKEMRLVSREFSNPTWFSGGVGGKGSHLLSLRESTLMAQPLDGKTLRPTGELVPVAEDVTVMNLEYARASVSPNGLLVYLPGSRTTRQLSWFDRTGKHLGDIGRPTVPWGLALSPDGKTVAIALQSDRHGVDLWLHDVVRGVETRFTFDDSANWVPIWSPDGKRIAFVSNRGNRENAANVSDLFLKETDGGKPEEALLPSDIMARYVTDWSRDGKFLLYNQLKARGSTLSVLPMEGERKPYPYLDTEFREAQGKFSPDGRWVAYASNESGRYEIYVRPFPAGPGKWRISSDGGELPQWRNDGQELFYVANRRLMSVGVKARPGAQPAFEAGAPAQVLERPVAVVSRGRDAYPYAVSPDGKRILMFHGDEARGDQLVVVQNWLEAAANKR